MIKESLWATNIPDDSVCLVGKRIPRTFPWCTSAYTSDYVKEKIAELEKSERYDSLYSIGGVIMTRCIAYGVAGFYRTDHSARLPSSGICANHEIFFTDGRWATKLHTVHPNLAYLDFESDSPAHFVPLSYYNSHDFEFYTIRYPHTTTASLDRLDEMHPVVCNGRYDSSCHGFSHYILPNTIPAGWIKAEKDPWKSDDLGSYCPTCQNYALSELHNIL